MVDVIVIALSLEWVLNTLSPPSAFFSRVKGNTTRKPHTGMWIICFLLTPHVYKLHFSQRGKRGERKGKYIRQSGKRNQVMTGSVACLLIASKVPDFLFFAFSFYLASCMRIHYYLNLHQPAQVKQPTNSGVEL